MKKIDIDIQLDPVKDGGNWVFDKKKNRSEGALIIGTNGKFRIVDKEEARDIFDRLSVFGDFDYIGKTSFLLIYNQKKVLCTDNTRFLIGSAIIVKATNKGIEFLNESEMMLAKKEFESRITTLCGNDILFSAYEIG